MTHPAGPCVLLVEDNPGDVVLFRKALQREGLSCALHVARDGVEAIDFLQRRGRFAQAPRPDLVILDLNLPRIPGAEVLRHIKADEGLLAIPVVILSSASDARLDLQRDGAGPAEGYLTKPSNVLELQGLLRALLARWPPGLESHPH